MSDIKIGPISFLDCKRVKMTDLVSTFSDKEVASLLTLVNDGFQRYLRRSDSLIEMLDALLSKAILTKEEQLKSVDAVIIASEKYDNCGYVLDCHRDLPPHLRFREGISYLLMCKYNLSVNDIYSCDLFGCGNMAAAFNMAVGLVRSKIHSNVMVIVLNKASDNSRMSENGETLFSDVALSFVVGDSQKGANVQFAINKLNSSGIRKSDESHKQEKALGLVKSLRFLKEHIGRAELGGRFEYDHYIIDNYSRSFTDYIVNIMCLDSNKIHTPSKLDYAHSFSVDTLLSLSLLCESEEIKKGENVCLINIGPWNVGAVGLRF